MAPSTKNHDDNASTGIAKKSSVHAGKADRSRVKMSPIEFARWQRETMRNMSRQLTMHDKTISELELRNAKQGTTLATQGGQIAALRAERAELLKKIQELKRGELHEKLAEMDRKLKKKTDAVKQRDLQLRQYATVLRQANEALREANKEISARDEAATENEVLRAQVKKLEDEVAAGHMREMSVAIAVLKMQSQLPTL